MGETGEVRITQYLRPNGIKRVLYADVDKEHADKAKDMIISCECITTQNIMLYGRLKTEQEEDEITELGFNGPGEDNPVVALCRLIDRLAARTK